MCNKICSKCQEEKDTSCFAKQKFGKNGIRSRCKSCESIMGKEYRLKNPPKPKSRDQQLKTQKYNKEKYNSDPIYREERLKRAREAKNSEKYKVKARLQRRKWLENPANRIAKNLRDRIRAALNNFPKSKSTRELTGIEYEELREYLQSKFTEGMTWDNYGQWHIDHIIPCSLFDLTNEDEQRICFYYKNLQPMWAKENIAKLNRVSIKDVQALIDEIKKDLLIS